MMTDPTRPQSASCLTAVERAWARMTLILFRPFDIGKWFVLGFTAWLATLFENGGGGGGGGSFPGGGDSGNASRAMRDMAEFIQEYLGIIITVVAVAVVVFFIIGLVVLWINSRGRFMFLSNVALNRAEVKRPWGEYVREGNSLFVWRFVFGVVCFLAFLAIAGTCLVVAWPSIAGREFGPPAVIAIILAVLLFIPYALLAAVINGALGDFVVPVMYIRRISTTEAWRCFLSLLKPNFWGFVLYMLLRIAMDMVAGMAILALAFGTCCCGLLIMMIPYIGTVLLLPYYVFFRAYGIEYLAQFGPDYDVFPAPPTTPTVAPEPVPGPAPLQPVAPQVQYPDAAPAADTEPPAGNEVI